MSGQYDSKTIQELESLLTKSDEYKEYSSGKGQEAWQSLNFQNENYPRISR